MTKLDFGGEGVLKMTFPWNLHTKYFSDRDKKLILFFKNIVDKKFDIYFQISDFEKLFSDFEFLKFWDFRDFDKLFWDLRFWKSIFWFWDIDKKIRFSNFEISKNQILLDFQKYILSSVRTQF